MHAFVTKRKISGRTISEKGRQARDVMLASPRIYIELKIPFFDYLDDRSPFQDPPSHASQPCSLPLQPSVAARDRLENTVRVFHDRGSLHALLPWVPRRRSASTPFRRTCRST